MANELDLLMDMDPLELSKQDIDKIIEYQRKARANFQAGIKPKKEVGPKKDLSEILGALAPKAAPAGPAIKRRV